VTRYATELAEYTILTEQEQHQYKWPYKERSVLQAVETSGLGAE